MAAKIGHEKRIRGGSSADNPLPLQNQITISLSRYILDKVEMIAIKRLMLSNVGV